MRPMHLIVVAALFAAPAQAATDCDIAAAVEAWAADWSRGDAARLHADAAFELQVTDTGESFRVELPRQGTGRVVAATGADYATRFSAPRDVYCDIASGRMNILTTLGQARPSDPTPMAVDIGAGYKDRVRSELIPAWFHFFATGAPEIVKFGFGHGRQVHGGHAVPLYYGEGLRTAWYGLKPGMHVNRDPADQTNEFDSIFVVLAGEVRARFDGREATVRKGESVFVPAGMRHEFWVDEGEGEFLVIMTGEGA